VISDRHFRETATEYDRKPGIKRLSCTATWQSDITPHPTRQAHVDFYFRHGLFSEELYLAIKV
jgi:hypothetical protein